MAPLSPHKGRLRSFHDDDDDDDDDEVLSYQPWHSTG